MNEVAVKTRAATAESGRNQTTDRLDALVLPEGGFTRAARQDALERLRAMGLPQPRDEYWRYTDPAAFVAPQPQVLAIPELPASTLFSDVDGLRIVFVDGRFDAVLSDALTLDGAQIDILSVADAQAEHWASDLYGVLEANGQNPVRRPLAVLNTAAAADGVLIRVTGRPARPIHIIHQRGAEDADALFHHVVRVETGAEVTLLETGTTGARSNAVLEVDLAPGARFHHVAAKRAEEAKVGIAHIFARVAESAMFKSFTLTVSGRFMRNEAVIDMLGDDAVAHVAGAALGDADIGPFHHDDTVFVTHAAERGESRQVFKKVLKNGAHGIFQGKILVKPGAQKTDGYQISQSLLLDEDSQFLAKPELEIYADDVKCSHGSTTGAIDDTALFYLRSRGVPRERAIVFLVLSFLADALAEVEDDGLREQISERLEAWLTQRATR